MRSLAATAFLALFLSCGPKVREQQLPTVPLAKQKELYETLLRDDPQAPYRVDLPLGSPAFPERTGNPLTKAGVQLGRWLFYDPILSGNNKMSCASCHVQSLAFTDGKRFSPGIHGEHVGRNAMSLVNLAWGYRFFWDGRAPTLEAQAVMPIKDKKELDQPMPELIDELTHHPVYPDLFRLAFGTPEVTEDRIGKAIAQFVKTIVSFESPLDEIRRVEMGLKKEEDIAPELRPLILSKVDAATRGAVALCGSCHNGTNYGDSGNFSALYGGTRITNNGLTPGLFRVPDLRNSALTGPYMHDGRFATLEEVLDHYDRGVSDVPELDPKLRDRDGKPRMLSLSPETKKNVLMYLRLMTDPSYLTNKEYSNPFR